MAIFINSSTSGFRKWSEAQRLKGLGGARGGAGDGGVIEAASVDHEVMTPDEKPHRPWLVPGAGKL